MDLKDIILQTLKEYQFGNNLKNGNYITGVEKKYFIDVADDIVEKLTVMRSSTQLKKNEKLTLLEYAKMFYIKRQRDIYENKKTGKLVNATDVVNKYNTYKNSL